MDSQRLILSIVFAGSLFMLYQKWVEEHTPKPVAAATSAIPAASDNANTAGGIPTAGPTAATAPGTTATANNPAASVSAQAAPAVKPEHVTVNTDLVTADIENVGGTLTRVEFNKHLATDDAPDFITRIGNYFSSDHGKSQETDASMRFVLLEETPEHTYVAQSGLIGDGAAKALPNHRTAYTFEPGAHELKDGEDKLEVRLAAPVVDGVKVTKVLVFHRASYVIDVRYEIINQGAAAVAPTAYFQIMRDGKPGPGQRRFVSSFTGPAYYSASENYHKVEFSEIDKGKLKDKFPLATDNGWIAMVQHYFVTAWLLPKASDPKLQYSMYAENVPDSLGLYRVGVKVPMAAIAPGASAQVNMPLYSGPEEQDKLAEVAPKLDLVVDYGVLTIIAEPLFKVLEWLHKWVNNWGVAIILLTIMIKALFYPLSAASYKSMARMRVITPRLTKLREQYGDDRMKMNQAMMELYKTEKINPLGGCLPIVVQIPIFMSLYWVLLASVEMRNAPFALWIHDLSAPDTYGVLPLIMTATSYIQIKLNPTPPDPVQAKVMLVMPIAFGIMFFWFPAGLVLYWVVNNVLSIAQQWQITRTIEGVKERPRR